MYRLKNRRDRSATEPIVETMVQFLKTWQSKVDAIVRVPPSNTARKNQPVIELATVISERAGIPLCTSCISKVKSTAQRKDVFERTQRDEILAGAFAVGSDQTKGKCRLDLYRSGATAGAITKPLLNEGACIGGVFVNLDADAHFADRG